MLGNTKNSFWTRCWQNSDQTFRLGSTAHESWHESIFCRCEDCFSTQSVSIKRVCVAFIGEDSHRTVTFKVDVVRTEGDTLCPLPEKQRPERLRWQHIQRQCVFNLCSGYVLLYQCQKALVYISGQPLKWSVCIWRSQQMRSSFQNK